jgi:uncharacterized protein YhaN
MRIDEIAVDGFGLIRDRRLAPAPGLTLIRGENEAGKSTLLAFIRSILFGFEPKAYPALAGGRRGGWLLVTAGDGRRVRIERYGITGGSGQLRLLDGDGDDLDAELLQRILQGVEKTVYRNVFAFGLAELTEFESLTGPAIADRIYGAGMGTGATSVVEIENRLEKWRSDVFVKQGRIPRINVLLGEIDKLESQIEAIDPPAIFRAAGGRQDTLEAELVGLSQAAEAIAIERRRLERLRDGWESWLALEAARPRSAELPAQSVNAVALPDDLLERLARVERDLAQTRERAAELGAERERASAERDAVAVDEALLAARPGAETLLAALPEARIDRTRLADLERDRAERAATLDEALRRLGPGWNEGRLLQVDDSLAAQGAISGPFRLSLETAERGLASAQAEVTTVQQSLTDARVELAAIDSRSATADPAAGPAEPSSAGPAPTSPLVALAGLLIGLLIGIAAGEAALLLGLGPLPAAFLALVIGALTTVGATLANRSGAHLHRPTSPLAQSEAARREERDGRVRLLEERSRVASDRLTAAGRTMDEAVAAWGAWLSGHGLPPDLDRETAARLVEGTITAKGSLAGLRAIEARRDDTAARLAAQEAGTEAFLVELGRPAQDPLAGLELVRRDLGAAIVAATSRNRAGLELERIEAAIAANEAALKAAEVEQAAVLTDGRSTDGAGLRAAVAEASRRDAVQREIRAAHDTLVALSGPGEAVAAFEVDLASFGDRARIQAELEAELERGRAIESRRTALLEELGAERDTIARIERSADAADLRQQRADRIAELQELADSWSVTTIALALLRRTRARYEREHRPEVLSVAEGLLTSWTNGRYVRILAPMGKPVQELERNDGVLVPLNALSTGMAQQLYLALRFGLVEHFAGQAESLPVVMDDILVNFDPIRAERAARSIEDLATRHQVLYFTCHPATPLAAARTIKLPALLGG